MKDFQWKQKSGSFQQPVLLCYSMFYRIKGSTLKNSLQTCEMSHPACNSDRLSINHTPTVSFFSCPWMCTIFFEFKCLERKEMKPNTRIKGHISMLSTVFEIFRNSLFELKCTLSHQQLKRNNKVGLNQ